VHLLLESKDEEEEEVLDEVRLGEEGWRDRYYRSKFNRDLNDSEFMSQFVQSYVEGLVWVLRYYYKGCCSWKWYFPYHYAPFARELAQYCPTKRIDLDLGKPFMPLEQLMSVLPAASEKIVPKAYRYLMSSLDSPIIDFYPADFLIDLNGKKQSWQGVALLPWIDENRLLQAMNEVRQSLSPEKQEKEKIKQTWT